MPNCTIDSQFLLDNGYMNPVQMPDGSWSAIIKLMFTYGLVSELHLFGYVDRWCYSDLDSAMDAQKMWFDNFDSMDEPTGWHRHPGTGRRVDKHGNVSINF